MPMASLAGSDQLGDIDWEEGGSPAGYYPPPPLDVDPAEIDWDIEPGLPAPEPNEVRVVQRLDFSSLVRVAEQRAMAVAVEQGDLPMAPLVEGGYSGEGRQHVIDSGEEWDWRALRDYVVRRSVEVHGPFPNNPGKEASIFRAFISRWGPERSQAIARIAFDVYGGFWRGAPIRVERFAKGSDPFFAEVLAAEAAST